MKLDNLTRATELKQTRDIFVRYIDDLSKTIVHWETNNLNQTSFEIAGIYGCVPNVGTKAYAPKHLIIKCMKDSKKYYETEIDKIDKEIATL